MNQLSNIFCTEIWILLNKLERQAMLVPLLRAARAWFSSAYCIGRSYALLPSPSQALSPWLFSLEAFLTKRKAAWRRVCCSIWLLIPVQNPWIMVLQGMIHSVVFSRLPVVGKVDRTDSQELSVIRLRSSVPKYRFYLVLRAGNSLTHTCLSLSSCVIVSQ